MGVEAHRMLTNIKVDSHRMILMKRRHTDNKKLAIRRLILHLKELKEKHFSLQLAM